MITIEEIRAALKWYDDTRPEHGLAPFKAEFELLKVAPEYIRTLLAEIDWLKYQLEGTLLPGGYGYFDSQRRKAEADAANSRYVCAQQADRATRAEQERDALRADSARIISELKLRMELYGKIGAVGEQIALSEVIDRFSKTANSSGVDPLLNKPGANEV